MFNAASYRVDTVLGPEHHVRNVASPPDLLAYRWRSEGAPALAWKRRAYSPRKGTISQSSAPRLKKSGSGSFLNELVIITESDHAAEASRDVEPCATPPPEGYPRRSRSPSYVALDSHEVQDFKNRNTYCGAMVNTGNAEVRLIEGLQQVERVEKHFSVEEGTDMPSPMMATLLTAKGLRSRRWHSDEKLVCLFLGVLTVLSFKECGVVVGGKHGLL